MSDIEWNDGYWLEAADRIHIIQNNLEEHVLRHPAVIKGDAEFEIRAAINYLSTAYQKVGGDL
jgi:hypothetical protein